MEKIVVGKKIRILRTNKNWSQYKLAIESGLSSSYITDLEKGLKSPTIETLDGICYALGVTLEEFFATKKESPSKDRLSSLSETQKTLLNEFLNSL